MELMKISVMITNYKKFRLEAHIPIIIRIIGINLKTENTD